MEVTGYLRILRQRWRLVLLPCVVAVAVAFITLPEEQHQGPVVSSYQATATLITPATTTTGSTAISLATVALYATVGEIPERAAQILDYQGEPQLLADQMTITPSAETGTLAISSIDADGGRAADRVNAFARATIDYFRDQQLEQDRIRGRELRRQLDETTAELEKLQDQQGSGEDAVLQSKITSLTTESSTLYSELRSLNQGTGRTDLLTVLQQGVPIPQTTQSFAAPANPIVRIGIAGLLGLLLGAALALVLERLDSRMRTREQVEDSIGLPVLAEIPILPRSHRAGVVSAQRPASVVAEAFRTLRSSVLLMSPGLAGGSARSGAKHVPLTILVTSALPGEGKTTTVANLAAVMAEAGRQVLVLSLDLRNPRLHDYLGVANSTGVSDLLAAGRGRQLGQVVRQTDIPGVAIATGGHDLDHPGALLASVGPMIAAAKALADVVIIDTPPMLTVSDAVDMAPYAEVTLLVTRLNKTTRTQAEECQRLFSRLGVSALGTVLVGSRPAGARYGYAMSQSEASRMADDEQSAIAGQVPDETQRGE